MPVTLPKTDDRNLEAILRQIRELAPFYTPEWNAGEESGASVGLQQIFSKLLEGLVQRLNEVPQRNFLEFLNMLGFKLLPAQPARAPVTFFVSGGATEPATIPAHSQVAGSAPDGGDPIIFETESAILATPAKLDAIFSAVPEEDKIFDHTPILPEDTATTLFAEAKNLQEHSLYLGDGYLFNLEGRAEIELNISPLIRDIVFWEYWGVRTVNDKEEVGWHPLIVDTVSLAHTITLLKDTVGEIKEETINEIKSRWIRCRVLPGKITNIESANIQTIKASAAPATTGSTGISPDMGFHNDMEVVLSTLFYPFGTRPRIFDTFYLASQEAFSKKGALITIDISICRVSIRAPKFQFPHSSGANVTKVTFTEGGSRSIRENVTAGTSEIALDSTDLSGEDIIRIVDPNQNKDEYLIIDTVTTSEKIVIKGTLLFSHSQDTEVVKVTRTNTSNTTVLRADVDEDDVCLKLQDSYAFAEGDVIQISTDPTNPSNDPHTEYQIVHLVSRPSADAVLAWEYWNGKGWTAIPGFVDNTLKLSGDGIITFNCPTDIEPVAVVGQENYWIRSRIIGGDYGQEEFKVVEGEVTSELNYRPPTIESLKVKYAPPLKVLDSVLIFNNLQYMNQTANSEDASAQFKPFLKMDDAHQTLYFGFDKPPLKGPISIFFSLVEQEYLEDSLPRITWEYFRRPEGQEEGAWARLEVQDGTRNLTESGTIEFLGPPDFENVTLFGKSLYWIRAIDAGSDKFGVRELISAQASKNNALREGLQTTCKGELICRNILTLFHPTFTIPAESMSIPALPIANGIFPNTTWISQAETIKDEILGSSDGLANQRFNLRKFPVISEEIWVNEFNILSAGEKKSLQDSEDFEILENKDENKMPIEFWVRWQSVDDMIEASATGRVYEIDGTFGVIQFGDGIHGMVPPIGRDNIRATYRAGGGAMGNLPKESIKTLRTTIPLVDKVTNPEPSGGGSDTELADEALVRGPQMLKNRCRAVTAEDFEWKAKEASRNVARVKCLHNQNDSGERETNWVTVVIVPNSKDVRPFPSPQLRKLVEKYLRDRSANVTVFPQHIHVTGPTYVEVSVSADLFPLTMDLAPKVETDAFSKLAEFLHPLTGGYLETGWEFGRLPCLSDFYLLFEAIEDVDHVENLSMTLRATSPTGDVLDEKSADENRPLDTTMPEYALIFSGDHEVNLKPL